MWRLWSPGVPAAERSGWDRVRRVRPENSSSGTHDGDTDSKDSLSSADRRQVKGREWGLNRCLTSPKAPDGQQQSSTF